MPEWFGSPAWQRAFWALAIIAASVIASFLAPHFVALLDDGRTALTRLREQLLTWMQRAVVDRWHVFWQAHMAEPREPVLAGLRRIDEAALGLGRDQVQSLQRLEVRLADHLKILRAATAPAEVARLSDGERIARAISDGGVGTIVFLVLLATVLGVINAALLSVFFREFLGARALLPTLLPALQLGHFLAMLFFVFEVASGWLIYRLGRRETVEGEQASAGGSRTQTFFYGVLWFVLVVLALMETVAYAVLSDRLNIPQQFALTPDSPFYGLLRFFFAFFGTALSAVLGIIGHSLGESLHRRARAKVEQRLLRALERRDETVATSVERVRTSLVAIQQAADGIPVSVARTFQEELGLEHAYPGTPLMLHLATVSAVSSTEPSTARALTTPGAAVPLPPMRTRTQVLGDLLARLAIGLVLVFVAALTTLEVVAWITLQPTPLRAPLAWAAGVALSAAMIALGMAARNALNRLRYATVVEQALNEPRGRWWFGLAVIGTSASAALLVAGLASAVGVLGAGLLLNWLLGLFQAGILVVLGIFLDAVLVAGAQAGYLLALGTVAAGAVLISLAALLLANILGVLAFAIQIIAVPGDVLRRVRKRTSPQLPTPQS